MLYYYATKKYTNVISMGNVLTVKYVSKILGTNPETIRRWLRAGILTACPKVGEKSASVIDPKSFESLVKRMPKYGPALFALGLIVGPVGAMAINALATTGVIKNGMLSIDNDLIRINDMEQLITSRINNKQTEKKLKENEIEKIKVEIEGIDNEINQLNKTLASLINKTRNSN